MDDNAGDDSRRGFLQANSNSLAGDATKEE